MLPYLELQAAYYRRDPDFGNTWLTEIWVCTKCGKVK